MERWNVRGKAINLHCISKFWKARMLATKKRAEQRGRPTHPQLDPKQTPSKSFHAGPLCWNGKLGVLPEALWKTLFELQKTVPVGWTVFSASAPIWREGSGWDPIQASASFPSCSGAVMALSIVPEWKQGLDHSNPTLPRTQMMVSCRKKGRVQLDAVFSGSSSGGDIPMCKRKEWELGLEEGSGPHKHSFNNC